MINSTQALNKKLNLGITIIFSILVFACNHNKTDSHSHTNNNHEHNNKVEEASIELDYGEKWKADDHTLNSVQKMEERVLAFNPTDDSDYKPLADSLEKDLDQLIAGCTMKGKAHDQLHKWLLPFIDDVKDLSKTESKTGKREQFEKIKQSFGVFHQSFQ